MKRFSATNGLVLLAAATLAAAACDSTSGSQTAAGAGTPAAAGRALAGTVTIDGSSTVMPVTRLVTESFRKEHAGVQMVAESSGTGAGFKKFCAGQSDINDASRPINQAESRECAANKVDFVELPFAFDSIAVVTNPRNTFVECLTLAELKTIWEPAAQGRIARWSQVRASFPDQALALFGPGNASGTFDYFTLAVVGKESASRTDYTKSEDESVAVNGAQVLVDGVANNAGALGYFGYSYYVANKQSLKLVAVDSGSGCVAPNAATVTEDRYQPLTRPLFVYVSTQALARPEVAALAQYYVAPESARFSLEAGYMPLPAATLLSIARRLDAGLTGSMFGGHGSVIGVTAATFEDEDRVRSALVQ